MRVLLLQPPKRLQVWAGVPSVFNDRFAYLFPPLGLMHLSSFLKKNTAHEVRLVDCLPDNLDFPDITTIVRRFAPDVVGMAASASHNLVNVARAIEAVRAARPDAFIVLGGAHVTSFPEFAARLAGVDAAIVGDGEEPFRLLLEARASGGELTAVPNLVMRLPDGTIHQSERLPNIEDLDHYPFPDRDACPPGKYFTPGMRGRLATTMISSRGCPFRCVFCNVPHAYRTRTPANIVDEIEECVRRHGVQDIHFVDDIFNITPERVMAVSEEILRRGVNAWWGYKASVRQTTREMIRVAKRAGCYRMHYGVETFTEDGLKALNKRATLDEIEQCFAMTREEGVKPIAYMIIGCPHEKAAAEILAADKFLKKLRPAYVVYSLFTPYPDAPVFAEGVKRGLWPADCWERFMLAPTADHQLPTAWEEHLTKAELVAIFKQLNRRFYFAPSTLWRTLTAIGSWAEVKRLALGGLSLLRMELVKAGSRDI
jgi:radical SAM superfamily enzyme YgiQ (UPF0313 family)